MTNILLAFFLFHMLFEIGIMVIQIPIDDESLENYGVNCICYTKPPYGPEKTPKNRSYPPFLTNHPTRFPPWPFPPTGFPPWYPDGTADISPPYHSSMTPPYFPYPPHPPFGSSAWPPYPPTGFPPWPTDFTDDPGPPFYSSKPPPYFPYSTNPPFGSSPWPPYPPTGFPPWHPDISPPYHSSMIPPYFPYTTCPPFGSSPWPPYPPTGFPPWPTDYTWPPYHSSMIPPYFTYTTHPPFGPSPWPPYPPTGFPPWPPGSTADFSPPYHSSKIPPYLPYSTYPPFASLPWPSYTPTGFPPWPTDFTEDPSLSPPYYPGGDIHTTPRYNPYTSCRTVDSSPWSPFEPTGLPPWATYWTTEPSQSPPYYPGGDICTTPRYNPYTSCRTVDSSPWSPFEPTGPFYPPWLTYWTTEPSQSPPYYPPTSPQYFPYSTHSFYDSSPWPPYYTTCGSSSRHPYLKDEALWRYRSYSAPVYTAQFYNPTTCSSCNPTDLMILLCFLKQIPAKYCEHVSHKPSNFNLRRYVVTHPVLQNSLSNPRSLIDRPILPSDLPIEVLIVLCHLRILPQQWCKIIPNNHLHSTAGSIEHPSEIITTLCNLRKLPMELCRNVPVSSAFYSTYGAVNRFYQNKHQRPLYPSDLPLELIGILCFLKFAPKDWCRYFNVGSSSYESTDDLPQLRIKSSDFPSEIRVILCQLNKLPHEWCHNISRNAFSYPTSPKEIIYTFKSSDIPHEVLVVLCRLHKLPIDWCNIITSSSSSDDQLMFSFSTVSPSTLPSWFTALSMQPKNLSWEWIVYLCYVLKIRFSWCPYLPTTWPPWLPTYNSSDYSFHIRPITAAVPTTSVYFPSEHINMPTWLYVLWWWCSTFIISPTLCGLFPFPQSSFSSESSLYTTPYPSPTTLFHYSVFY